jgi:ribosomal protein S18 acetylase RimI-like enzyme
MRDRRSLGWETNLFFAEFDGLVLDRGDCIVVRSPLSPGYYWGNFLLFDHAPVDADFEPWMQRFEAEIVGPQPSTRHVAFGVDAELSSFAAPPAFERAGFKADGMAVLTLRRAGLSAPPRAVDAGITLRGLVLPDEAAAAVDLNVACNDAGFEPAGYRRFREAQMQRYGAMDAAGLGHWFGAVESGRIVASLGLFGRAGVGRFQYVETHPQWRRRGLCSALVHAACRQGFEQMGFETLVMCADPHDVAIGIYESVGFVRAGMAWTLERRAPEDLPAD